jgi:hypothetical protein
LGYFICGNFISGGIGMFSFVSVAENLRVTLAQSHLSSQQRIKLALLAVDVRPDLM